MGECMSICQRNKSNYDNEDSQEGIHKPPSRTKKNKTRMPQNEISDDDDDEDIPITKHISLTNDEIEIKNSYIFDNLSKENPETIEKIKKAKKNWEYLKDKLVQKRIDILREIVKKEKVENESDEEEDEKIDDILKNKSNDKKENINKTYNKKLNNIYLESKEKDGENNDSIEEIEEKENV
jgi:hypothetical protein